MATLQTAEGLQVRALEVSDLCVTATGAANAGAGLFHYITSIIIQRTATAALVGSATLVITTTNLPGSMAYSVGNAMAAGGTQNDLNLCLTGNPLKSSVANTATTIVCPVPGAAVLWRITATYFAKAGV